MATSATSTYQAEPVQRPGLLRGPRRRGRGTLSALVADDDQGALTAISRLLDSQGFQVFTCRDGNEAVELFRRVRPSAVLLELRLRGIDGLAVCRRLRSESEVPIMVVTILSDEVDAVRPLDAGADDFVRKPFGTEELMARLRAVLRRAHVETHQPERLVAGPLVVDERQHLAFIEGAELVLSRTEFRLLAYMMRNADRVLTHDQILEQVWGWRYVGAHHVLRVTMSRLRRKLQGARRHNIETLTGVGYRFRLLAGHANQGQRR